MPILATHPVPHTYRPAAVGTIVLVGALPLFYVAGWPVKGWVIAAVLWTVSQGIALVLLRTPIGMGNLAGSGAVAMGRLFRSMLAMVVLLVVTTSNQSLGVPAAAVYAAAFSAEFGTSLFAYYGEGGEARS